MIGRVFHSATLLHDGTVSIAGGEDQADESAPGPNWQGYVAFATTEIFDSATASFKPYKPMTEGRFWHSATLLPSGAVLLVGGIGSDMPLATAETDR